MAQITSAPGDGTLPEVQNPSPTAPSSPAAVVNFVVLGHPRCGSNLVLRELSAHPQVRMLGEILANEATLREAAWNWISPFEWIFPRCSAYTTGKDAATFLDQCVFSRKRVLNSLAFGFKFFYEHARHDAAIATAWEYLERTPDIHILHLRRRNLLNALISREVATRTGRWQQLVEDPSPAPDPVPPFALAPGFCSSYFDEIERARERADRAFAHHPILHIEYERDLCGNFHATAAAMQRFLNVMPWDSFPYMKKQQSLTPSQQLSNFDELKRYFRNTPYAEFFEHDTPLPPTPPPR